MKKLTTNTVTIAYPWKKGLEYDQIITLPFLLQIDGSLQLNISRESFLDLIDLLVGNCNCVVTMKED